MHYKQIFQQFKEQYVEAGESFSFGLFPILFLELKNHGLDQSSVDENFFKELQDVFLPGEKATVLVEAIEYIKHYTVHTLPKARTKTVVQPVEEKAVEVQSKIEEEKTETTLDPTTDVPTELEEGDPLYTPPDQMIDLKPEDFPDKQYDWDFLKRIGAVGIKE